MGHTSVFTTVDIKLSLSWFINAHSYSIWSIYKMSSGYLPGVWVLKADVSEHCRFHLQQFVKCGWGLAGIQPVFLREVDQLEGGLGQSEVGAG